MKTVFYHSNYRFFLKNWIHSQNAHFGLLSKVSQALECQNSHITRVLKEEVHLTMDQAFRMTEFMKLTETECTYFLKLVEYDRSCDSRFRKRLLSEMEHLREDHENLSKRLNVKTIQSHEFESVYYSNWIWSAIHVITDIPMYQTSEAIAKRLHLEERVVRTVLEKLENYGLVIKKGNHWEFVSGIIHLPKSSPMNSVQHGNWRARAVLHSQDSENDGLHFSVVQALGKKDYIKIKQLFLDSIDEYRKIANPSKSEELTCLTLDFFQV